MTCDEISKLLSDYIDGYLSDSLCEVLEIHIQSCEACAQKLESTRRVVLAMGQLSCQKSPVDCWIGVQKRIIQQQKILPLWRRWIMNPVIAAPALAVLILTLFLVWPSPVNEPKIGFVPNVEYSRFISAHSRLQRQQAFSDHDVTFVAAELENASFTPDVNRR